MNKVGDQEWGLRMLRRGRVMNSFCIHYQPEIKFALASNSIKILDRHSHPGYPSLVTKSEIIFQLLFEKQKPGRHP